MNNRRDRERRPRNHWRPSRGQAAGKEAAAPQADVAPPPRSRRLWLILLFCLVGSTAASFVVFKYVLVKIPPELVGTWQVTAGSLRGWTLEFRRDGTAIATRYERGQKIVTDYSAKVEGKSMWLTTRDEKTGKEDTVTQTIVELTADELVIRDEDQITYHMKRVSN
jgi:uncharacterized protein (TIGR03066 family)